MKLKKILPQFLTLLFIVLIFGFFTMNAQENMDTRGIEFGFGFLKQEASFDIQFSLIDYDGSKSYARAYLVGLLNTLLVSAIGIVLCTILGVVIGVARLSPNYLINKTASFYIEFFRNIPLLLQIFFWYFAALRALPMPEDASLLLGTSYMTIKGLYTPAPIWNNFDVFLISLIISLTIIFFFNRYAKRKQEEAGIQYPKFLISLGIFIIIPALTFIFGSVSSVTSVAIPFLKLLIPFATSPIKLEILPRPNNKTTNITTTAICQIPMLIETYNLFMINLKVTFLLLFLFTIKSTIQHLINIRINIFFFFFLLFFIKLTCTKNSAINTRAINHTCCT